ncbi:TonB-dependent receptor [Candidatus Poribacteria bacterium]|nr:TonB-dependent receptor [Candidatus Poribacteria bacterium]
MKKYFLMMVLLFLSNLYSYVYSEEKKKDAPPIELPAVTIIGEEKDLPVIIGEKTETIKQETRDVLKPLPLGIREKETSFGALDNKQELIVPRFGGTKNYLLNFSLITGNYNFYSIGFVNGGQDYNNNYLLDYSFTNDGGERKNSSSIENKFILDVTHTLMSKENTINVYVKFNSYDMKLPSKETQPQPFDSMRRTDDLFIFANWEKKKTADDYMKLGYFWSGQSMDNRDSSPVNENKTMGIEYNYAFVYENPTKFLARLSNNQYLKKGTTAIYDLGLETDISKLINDLNLHIGILYTNYQDIDNQASPRINLAYRLSNDFILDAKAKQEFAIPDFAELYCQNNFMRMNPDRLKPEKSWNYEFGFSSKPFHAMSAGLHVYENDIINKVIFDNEINGLWQPVNLVEKAKITGANFDLNWAMLTQLKLTANYIYAKTETQNKEVVVVPLVPEHDLKLVLSYLNNLANIDISGKYIGNRFYDKDETKEKLSPYFLWGAKIYKNFNKNFNGFISLENITSTKKGYEVIKDYPSKNARYKAGVMIKF